MSKKILVTGAAGLEGKHVRASLSLSQLAEKKNMTIKAVVLAGGSGT